MIGSILDTLFNKKEESKFTPGDTVIVEVKNHPDASPNDYPKKATRGSAGYDLISVEDVTLKPGETKLIQTSFAWAIPENHVGLVCSRSGLALKQSVFVLNAPGVIDSDYRGNLGVILHNAGTKAYNILLDDKIAQMVIVKHADTAVLLVNSLNETARGTGGFGSTGK